MIVSDCALAIEVGGVDGVEAFGEEGVENRERLCLVDGTADDIGAENQRFDMKLGAAEAALAHVSVSGNDLIAK